MNSRWTLHQGKRVFISDFSNCGTAALLVSMECDEIKDALAHEPPKSILAIVNVDGTLVTPEIIQAFRQLIPVTNKYVKRRAIIGLNGFRRHFISLVSKVVNDVNFARFDTLDEALDWIVRDEVSIQGKA